MFWIASNGAAFRSPVVDSPSLQRHVGFAGGRIESDSFPHGALLGADTYSLRRRLPPSPHTARQGGLGLPWLLRPPARLQRHLLQVPCAKPEQAVLSAAGLLVFALRGVPERVLVKGHMCRIGRAAPVATAIEAIALGAELSTGTSIVLTPDSGRSGCLAGATFQVAAKSVSALRQLNMLALMAGMLIGRRCAMLAHEAAEGLAASSS